MVCLTEVQNCHGKVHKGEVLPHITDRHGTKTQTQIHTTHQKVNENVFSMCIAGKLFIPSQALLLI